MSNLILLLWAGIFGFFVYLAVQMIQGQGGTPRRYVNQKPIRQITIKSPRAKIKPQKPQSKITRSKYQKSRLWGQLQVKCRGDARTALRLLEYLERKHPGQSSQWYLEKAIHDIERDNRY
ncbi:hypothetical protein [Nodularia sphaerocarpa]|uniref:hypothetical protein n=1 Tax=Nodularia sphaerocarpa TaxID=137816 RepID=UPI001EFB93DD|nr:hypothetical protein [Nodularia sphaerocarpa]MDB9374141.1 hypothetical protein [Nodularia sphaerocarpa CS-585]MDB9377723.1 hypothetical protein [Nodularia sphaerocarpa CS-585A2]